MSVVPKSIYSDLEAQSGITKNGAPDTKKPGGTGNYQGFVAGVFSGIAKLSGKPVSLPFSKIACARLRGLVAQRLMPLNISFCKIQSSYQLRLNLNCAESDAVGHPYVAYFANAKCKAH